MRLILGVMFAVACSQPTGLRLGGGDGGMIQDAPAARCGDGIIEGSEVCDDGNTVSGDGCSADCMSDETCGNGIVDVNEACDDGNTVGGDGCSADCKSDETCGNGIIDHTKGETCDDGNTIGGDGCSANCQSNETCGNGIVDPGEACDSFNQFTATCNPDCTAARCGDGIVNPAANEQCDDANSSNTDGCLNNCRVATCGDGFVEAGVETCDDGNQISGDGCDSTCHIEVRLVNPSFEQNYNGWTLIENAGAGAWGIGQNTATIQSTDDVFDFTSSEDILASCLGQTGPLVIQATDGSFAAFNIQVAAEDRRMYQDVAIPAGATLLTWDMAYRNSGSFDPTNQFTAINIRDPSSDTILETVFKTVQGVSAQAVPMSTFAANISAFAGMTVRLDVEHQVEEFCYDIVFDNFAIR